MSDTRSDYASRWSSAALGATLNANYGTGADADLPAPLRFARGIASLAVKRLRSGVEASPDTPIFFVMSPSVPEGAPIDRTRLRVPMVDNGLHAIGGKIWFMNYAVNEGEALEVKDGEDDAQLFQLLRGELDVGSLPAAVLETRNDLLELRFYPDGLGTPEICEVTDLRKRELTPDEVYAALESIYQSDLVSPSSQVREASVWKQAATHRAHEDAEGRVQSVLKVGLTREFKGFIVRSEQPQQTGRLDLEIEEPDPVDRSTVTRHIVLELKVLREKGATGSPYGAAKNALHLADGVVQARSYQEERGSRHAAVCCYDMRAAVVGDAMFDNVSADAQSCGVLLWGWHLFGRDSDFRESLLPDGADSDGGS